MIGPLNPDVLHCHRPLSLLHFTVMTITLAVISIIFTILLVGVGLAGLILNGQRELKREFKRELHEFKREFEALRAEVLMLRERMAHLEGLLEGLREAITGRRAA